MTLQDHVSKLVERELRHVSNGTTLDEMGRILARNRFALVEKTKFITTTDLLKTVVPAQGSCDISKTPGSSNSSSQGSSVLGFAASAIMGAGLAAAATFFLMKNK